MQCHGVSTGSIETIDIEGAQELTSYTEGPDSYSIFLKNGYPVAASDNMNFIHRVMGEYLAKTDRQKLPETTEQMVSYMSLKDLGCKLESLVKSDNQIKQLGNFSQQEKNSDTVDVKIANKMRNG